MREMRLYVVQRVSAALMLPLILGHLVVIFYATRGGLSAAEVLARTRGSYFWGGFYGLFVLLASVHAAIGVRVVLREWTGLSASVRDALMWGLGVLLLLLGLRAVYAVVLA